MDAEKKAIVKQLEKIRDEARKKLELLNLEYSYKTNVLEGAFRFDLLATQDKERRRQITDKYSQAFKECSEEHVKMIESVMQEQLKKSLECVSL